MKLDKIAITLMATIFFISIAHQSLALPNQTPAKSINAKSTNNKKYAKKNGVRTKSKKIAKSKIKSKKSSLKKATPTQENQEILNEINALEMQASNGYVPEPKSSIWSNTKSNINTQSNTQLRQVAPDQMTSPFTGGVNFTYGHDSNIDPDKTNENANFVLVEPKVSYKNGGFSASAGAGIRDYADQEKSNQFKQTEAKADVGYTFDINNIANSTTTVAVLYHDERWPDYINGPDLNGVDHGMPIRYVETTLSEKLGFNLGILKLEAGGSYAHRDALNLYSDFAPDIFGEKKLEKDYDEISGFGKATLSAGQYVDFSLRPLIKQTKYTEREGRLSSGHVAGLAQRTPLYELITSELGFDIAFKYKSSNITPKAIIGQVSDEALGAEDQSYYGYGIAANLVLYEPLKLTITPNAMYKKIKYDNWVSTGYDSSALPTFIENGEKRLEDEVSTGVTASIMATKNFGVNLAYAMIKETSNLKDDSSENYRQEVISSTLVFTF